MALLNYHIPGQRLESFAIALDDGQGYVARFTGLYVSCGARFSSVGPADDFAEIAISYRCTHRLLCSIHFLTSIGTHLPQVGDRLRPVEVLSH